MLSLASWARRLSRLRDQQKTTWLTGFLAVLYYEFLWNLRKKKIIGLFILVFVIVTLSLALPPLLDYLNGVTLAPTRTLSPASSTRSVEYSSFLSPSPQQ